MAFSFSLNTCTSVLLLSTHTGFIFFYTPSVQRIGSFLISSFHPNWSTSKENNVNINTINTITINFTGGVIIVTYLNYYIPTNKSVSTGKISGDHHCAKESYSGVCRGSRRCFFFCLNYSPYVFWVNAVVCLFTGSWICSLHWYTVVLLTSIKLSNFICFVL